MSTPEVENFLVLNNDGNNSLDLKSVFEHEEISEIKRFFQKIFTNDNGNSIKGVEIMKKIKNISNNEFTNTNDPNVLAIKESGITRGVGVAIKDTTNEIGEIVSNISHCEDDEEALRSELGDFDSKLKEVSLGYNGFSIFEKKISSLKIEIMGEVREEIGVALKQQKEEIMNDVEEMINESIVKALECYDAQWKLEEGKAKVSFSPEVSIAGFKINLGKKEIKPLTDYLRRSLKFLKSFTGKEKYNVKDFEIVEKTEETKNEQTQGKVEETEQIKIKPTGELVAEKNRKRHQNKNPYNLKKQSVLDAQETSLGKSPFSKEEYNNLLNQASLCTDTEKMLALMSVIDGYEYMSYEFVQACVQSENDITITLHKKNGRIYISEDDQTLLRIQYWIAVSKLNDPVIQPKKTGELLNPIDLINAYTKNDMYDFIAYFCQLFAEELRILEESAKENNTEIKRLNVCLKRGAVHLLHILKNKNFKEEDGLVIECFEEFKTYFIGVVKAPSAKLLSTFKNRLEKLVRSRDFIKEGKQEAVFPRDYMHSPYESKDSNLILEVKNIDIVNDEQVVIPLRDDLGNTIVDARDYAFVPDKKVGGPGVRVVLPQDKISESSKPPLVNIQQAKSMLPEYTGDLNYTISLSEVVRRGEIKKSELLQAISGGAIKAYREPGTQNLIFESEDVKYFYDFTYPLLGFLNVKTDDELMFDLYNINEKYQNFSRSDLKELVENGTIKAFADSGRVAVNQETEAYLQIENGVREANKNKIVLTFNEVGQQIRSGIEASIHGAFNLDSGRAMFVEYFAREQRVLSVLAMQSKIAPLSDEDLHTLKLAASYYLSFMIRYQNDINAVIRCYDEFKAFYEGYVKNRQVGAIKALKKRLENVAKDQLEEGNKNSIHFIEEELRNSLVFQYEGTEQDILDIESAQKYFGNASQEEILFAINFGELKAYYHPEKHNQIVFDQNEVENYFSDSNETLLKQCEKLPRRVLITSEPLSSVAEKFGYISTLKIFAEAYAGKFDMFNNAGDAQLRRSSYLEMEFENELNYVKRYDKDEKNHSLEEEFKIILNSVFPGKLDKIQIVTIRKQCVLALARVYSKKEFSLNIRKSIGAFLSIFDNEYINKQNIKDAMEILNNFLNLSFKYDEFDQEFISFSETMDIIRKKKDQTEEKTSFTKKMWNYLAGE